MTIHRRYSKVAGVSLIELIAVMAIVGLLAAVAVPAYQDARLKTNRPTGSDCIQRVQQRMEGHFAKKNKYTATLSDLGYTGTSLSCDPKNLYVLTVANPTGCPISNCYQLLATANGSQAKDGSLRLTYRPGKINLSERIVRERNVNGTWQAGWE